MGRVEDLEAAIDSLPPEDYIRLAEWFRERDQADWDNMMDSDFQAGKLEFFFEEAEAGFAAGLLREWPSST